MQNLRFMVVDADDFEAMLTGAALSALGHRVDKFTSAEVAIDALCASPGAYAAVLASELNNMTRVDFAREAQRSDTALRVVFTGKNPMALPNVTVLPKSQLLADPVGAMRSLFEERLPIAA
jgi:hypothetical protein